MGTILPALKRITFKEEHKKEGSATILLAGTVVWKGQGIYLVEPTCLAALEQKGIPYIVLNAETGQSESR